MSANYFVKNNIGIIEINNPPVNALSSSTRLGILSCLQQAENDTNSKAVVICGSGKTFPVGADLSEFGNAKFNERTSLAYITEIIENFSKPIVAAITGNALGGGLELALGCHYRIASANAKVGLPEVKVGLLPGGSGTQRLPRVIGFENAMEWITSGKHFTIKEAVSVGLIDKVVPSSTPILEAGIEFATSVIRKSYVHLKTSKRPIRDIERYEGIVKRYKVKVAKNSRGTLAQFLCIQAVQNSALFSYEEGINRETELMKTLVTSTQSKAQIYAFFSQREIRKWNVPNSNINYKTAKPTQVYLAAVIGLGTMGRGIVISFLRAGIPVIALEMNEKFLKSGIASVNKLIDQMLNRSIIKSEQHSFMKKNIHATTNYKDLHNVDFVIEAVFETMSIKKEVFKKLDQSCKPSAILASNTSALDIDEIASATNRPHKVMGTHFFAPAHIMKLLENIRGEKTDPETIATGMNIGKLMNKVTVLVGNCPGFVGNRMYFNYNIEGDFMLEEGAYPIDIDKAILSFGFPMGKYAVNDLSGNDLAHRMRKGRGVLQSQQPKGTRERERNGARYCPIGDFLFEMGRHGLKTGKGWHDYLPEDKSNPVPSKDVQKMIDNYRKKHNIIARRVDDEEILERLLYPLINEGFKILSEGFASTPMDIDMVWLYGYSWPIHTGGPMYYAFTVGLPKLLERMEFYYEKFGNTAYHWIPSDMLKWLAREHGNPPITEWMKLWNNRKAISHKL